MPQIFVKVPFALSGGKLAIPEAVQPGGEVSFTEGYGPLYSQDPTTTGLRLDREQSNELFYILTTGINQYQTESFPRFITTTDNGGVPYSYSKYATVLYDDGGGLAPYQSLVNTNTALPTVTANWRKLDPYNRLIERDSPAFTGTPTAPTQPANDNSTKLATTAYVDASAALAPKMYSTPAQNWVRATKLYTFAHTLGAIPKSAQLVFVCTAADGQYSIGDVVILPAGQAQQQGANDYGYQTKVTAANLKLSIDTNHSLLMHEWNNQSNFNPADGCWTIRYDVIG